MPYLIVRSCWPSARIPEIIKKAIEVLKKYPPDDSLGEAIVPNAVKTTTDGIKTISVTEVKKGKLEEAIARTNEALVMYAPVEGWEASIEVWSTLTEAYAVLGKVPPE